MTEIFMYRSPEVTPGEFLDATVDNTSFYMANLQVNNQFFANNLVAVGNTTEDSGISINSTSILIGNLTHNIVINASSFLGTVGGPNNAVQFNGSGILSASNGFLFDPTTNTVSIGTGTINALAFSGTANNSNNSNNTNFVGTVSAANVVSNAQLQGNLAAYAPLSNPSFVGNVSVSNNLVVTGTLTVSNVVYINSSAITTNDSLLVIANGALTSLQANGAGIILGNNIVSFLYENAQGAFVTNVGLDPLVNNQSLGNTSALWNLFGNQIQGTLTTVNQPNIIANDANYLGGVIATSYVTASQQAGNLALYEAVANLSGDVAKLSSNNSSYFGGQSPTYYANVTSPSFLTSIGVGSNLSINTSTLAIGNLTVNVTVNSSTIVWNAGPSINSTSYSGSANNSTNLGGQPASAYQTVAGLPGNVALLTSNSSTYFGGQLPAYYANVTSPLFSTSVSIGNSIVNTFANSSQITVNQISANSITANQVTVTTLKPTQIQANGSLGTAGWVMISGGASGNSYWANAGVASPGGANTALQFNQSGVFGGSANLSWSETNGLIVGDTTLTKSDVKILPYNLSITQKVEALGQDGIDLSLFENGTGLKITGNASIGVSYTDPGVGATFLNLSQSANHATTLNVSQSGYNSVVVNAISTTGQNNILLQLKASPSLANVFAITPDLGVTALMANGGVGTVGQVLISNGSIPYWGSNVLNSNNSAYLGGQIASSYSPVGSNGVLQFYNNGVLGGDANLNYNVAAQTLTFGNSSVNTQINSTSIGLPGGVVLGGNTTFNNLFYINYTGNSTPSQGIISGINLLNTFIGNSALGGIEFMFMDDGGIARHGAMIIAGKSADWVGGSGLYSGYLQLYTRQGGAEALALTLDSNQNGIFANGLYVNGSFNVAINTAGIVIGTNGASSLISPITIYAGNSAATQNYQTTIGETITFNRIENQNFTTAGAGQIALYSLNATANSIGSIAIVGGTTLTATLGNSTISTSINTSSLSTSTLYANSGNNFYAIQAFNTSNNGSTIYSRSTNGAAIFASSGNNQTVLGFSSTEIYAEGDINSGAGLITLGAKGAIIGCVGTGNLVTFAYYANASAGATIFGGITCNATAVAYNTVSDIRLKENIYDTAQTMPTLMEVKVRDFNFIGSEGRETGFIAQEIAEIFPSVVAKGKVEEDYWQVDYSKMVPFLTRAIQDLQKQVNDLQIKINSLL